jgi:hypothetical protein
VKEGRGEHATAGSFAFEEDLNEGDRGQVVSRPGVHDGEVLSFPDHPLQRVQGHVTALLKIVELAI